VSKKAGLGKIPNGEVKLTRCRKSVIEGGVLLSNNVTGGGMRSSESIGGNQTGGRNNRKKFRSSPHSGKSRTLPAWRMETSIQEGRREKRIVENPGPLVAGGEEEKCGCIPQGCK